MSQTPQSYFTNWPAGLSPQEVGKRVAGDGWVAAGMAEMLRDLPADHLQRAH